MPYNIVYTAYAERDIWQIAEYLCEHSPPAAETFLREVKKRVEQLADMPHMYPQIDPAQPYRKMVLGNYVVIYAPYEPTSTITVKRVVHGKRNYKP